MISTKIATKENLHSPWQILGAGAIGGLWAAKLQQAHIAVALVGKPDRQNAPYQLNLRLISHFVSQRQAQQRLIKYSPSDHLADNSVQQLIIATKSTQVLLATQQILDKLTDDATVVCVSNGMGYQLDLIEALNQKSRNIQLYWGVSSDGATATKEKTSVILDKLSIKHTGQGHTFVGPLSTTDHQEAGTDKRYVKCHSDRIDSLLQGLSAAELSIEKVSSVNQYMWNKFFINCVINPLTALYRCKNGELINNADYYKHFQALSNELNELLLKLDTSSLVVSQKPLKARQTADNSQINVPQKESVSLPLMATDVAQKTAANTSSMLQDVLNRRKTEIETMNAYLQQMASILDTNCPINEKLLTKLESIIELS